MESSVVVITGASAGVGRATAHAFAARGARIGLIARNREALEATRGEVEVRGGKAVIAVADVADPAAVERAAGTIEEAFGTIDIWINNAMTSVLGPIREIPPDEFRRVTEVTYLGYVHGTQAALRRMLPRDKGLIIQIGSALAYRGIPLQAPYCAAKHAIQGFQDALLSELLHDGSNVRTCMVNLPAMNTPQFRWLRNHMPRKAQPVGPVFEPEMAAQAIVWISEHPRRDLNVGAGTSALIIANAIAPGLLDHFLASEAWDGQLGPEPEEPGRPDYLFEPLPGDAGVRGPFGDRAKATSPQLWANTHRAILFGAAGMLALAGLASVLRSGPDKPRARGAKARPRRGDRPL